MLKEPQAWPNFGTELEMIQTLQICYSDFKIFDISKEQNGIDDSLAKNAYSFLRVFCYNGYSISVRLSKLITRKHI